LTTSDKKATIPIAVRKPTRASQHPWTERRDAGWKPVAGKRGERQRQSRAGDGCGSLPAPGRRKRIPVQTGIEFGWHHESIASRPISGGRGFFYHFFLL